MIVIPRTEITPAMLLSTTAVDEPQWSGTHTYALYDRCAVGQERYVSLQPNNVGHSPSEPGSLWWRADGPVNRLRMLDTSPQTLTEVGGNTVVHVQPGRFCTAILLTGVGGITATLEVFDGLALLQTRTQSIITSDGTEYGYYFGDTVRLTDVVWLDLPVTATSYRITVTGTHTSVGVLLMGRAANIGQAEKGASIETRLRGRDYIDANDNPVATDKGFSRELSCTLVTERAQFGRVKALMEGLVQTHAGWVVAPGVGDYDSAVIVGRFQRSVMVMDAEGSSYIKHALEVAGNR